jgi:hypothetical protein
MAVWRHRRMDLSDNRFSDSIAALSATFPLLGLHQLRLGNNRMTGNALVIDVNQYPLLTEINISHNQFSGVYSNIVDDNAFGLFDARGNNFECPLPPWPLQVRVMQNCHQTFTAIGLTLVCIGSGPRSLFRHCRVSPS